MIPMTDRANRQLLALGAMTVLLLVGCHVAACGQSSPSKIQPTSEVKLIVTAPVGAVIQHTDVAFRGENTLTTKQTSQDGSVQLTLPYGRYVVTITSPGFNTVKITDFLVDAARPTFSHVMLEVAPFDASGVDLEAILISSDLPNVIESNVTGRRVQLSGAIDGIVWPHQSIENRRWRIAKYRGDGSQHGDDEGLIAATDPAEITFLDGWVQGSPGCGGWEGTYKVSGDLVTVRAELVLNGFCYPAGFAQDRLVEAAFKGELRIEKNGDHFLLRDGQGNARILLLPY